MIFWILSTISESYEREKNLQLRLWIWVLWNESSLDFDLRMTYCWHYCNSFLWLKTYCCNYLTLFCDLWFFSCLFYKTQFECHHIQLHYLSCYRKKLFWNLSRIIGIINALEKMIRWLISSNKFQRGVHVTSGGKYNQKNLIS